VCGSWKPSAREDISEPPKIHADDRPPTRTILSAVQECFGPRPRTPRKHPRSGHPLHARSTTLVRATRGSRASADIGRPRSAPNRAPREAQIDAVDRDGRAAPRGLRKSPSACSPSAGAEHPPVYNLRRQQLARGNNTRAVSRTLATIARIWPNDAIESGTFYPRTDIKCVARFLLSNAGRRKSPPG